MLSFIVCRLCIVYHMNRIV